MFLSQNIHAPRTRHRSFWRTSSAVCSILVLMLVLAGCGGSSSTTATPTTSVSVYTNIPLKIPADAYNAQLIGPLAPGSPLHLGVSFKVNSSVLPKSQGQIPTGKNVDVSKIANEYGISDATFQQIKAYLGVQDVTLDLGKLHSYMSVTAKASTIEKLFQTKFEAYKKNNREYYVPDPNLPPKLPSFIMSYVVAITGLESYYTLTPSASGLSAPAKAAMPLTTTKHQAADCTGAPDTQPPQDIAAAYGYTPFIKQGYDGTGVTINLVELGGIAADDLVNYFACVNFPRSHFSYKDIITPAAQPDPGGTGEAALDIEMIAGLAPGANIVDYEAAIPDPSQGVSLYSEFELLNGDLQAIINDNILGNTGVNLVSVSYGAAESYIDPSVMNAIDQSLQTLVSAEKMTVFVSTGDCGAFGGKQLNQLAVQFPSTDPWATAVGGTELAVNGQGNRVNEVVWSTRPTSNQCTDNSWGTGGGVSQVFKRPSWQQGSGVTNTYSDGARQVPDVAAIAINIPLYLGGQWHASGGTSAATPIWASGLALVNQALVTRVKEFVYGPDLFYAVADHAGRNRPYFDITQGNNLYYPASVGWDDTTGWGSPNLVDFYNTILSLL